MTDLDVLAVLKGTRELLTDPANWTQGTSARDDEGDDLVARLEDEFETDNDSTYAACMHPEASCWCLGGALTRIAGENVRFDDQRFEALWARVNKAVGPWNDEHDHADVLKVLDETIETLEASRVAA